MPYRKNMITIGIDIGSITAKGVVFSDGKILATQVIFTGYSVDSAGKRILEEVLEIAGIDRDNVDKIVSTGYGRKSVLFADKVITEITCHGAGAYYTNPEIRTVIDIGGQDSKALSIDQDGRVRDFAMNDKCAAGTGRFLEVMARALEADLDKFGEMSLLAKNPSKISSLCTVFAESEVISLISKGETRENIMAGIHQSVAARVAALANRVGINEPVMMTGGVAKNIGLVKALENKLKVPIIVTDSAQENGAIGAAVLAAKL
jgi:predicted CoA-substrate-specific enzyme activase